MKKTGFTLVEIMVSVSIFAVVALAATNAFITADRVSKKAQAMKTVIDNLHFALNMISFDLQQGGSYHCLAANDPLLTVDDPAAVLNDSTVYQYGQDCHIGTPGGRDGGDGIVFRSPKTGAGAMVIYKFDPHPTDPTKNQISFWRSDSGSNAFVPITVENLEINNLKFFVHNASPGPSNGSPRVFFTINGEANLGRDLAGNDLKTPFRLQTVVSERI